MEKDEGTGEHEKFKELCALAQLNSLSVQEQFDLERHLRACGTCRQAYEEYCAIGSEGMAYLLAREEPSEEALRWDNSAAQERLFQSVRRPRPQRVLSIEEGRVRQSSRVSKWPRGSKMAIGTLAACALIALSFGAYRIEERWRTASPSISAVSHIDKPNLLASAQTAGNMLASETARIAEMEKQIARQQEEIARLRADSIATETRATELGSASGEKEAALRQIAEERDQLAKRLADSERAYEVLQADYTALKADHGRSLLHTASLESELTELRAASLDQERRLKDDAQFLTSDRDIRELMGARKLYIADVFDVDSDSHTRKPFGRVFYTQNKSLVFYAFDLDHQPGVKNASVFQVWGQRDGEPSGNSHAMNLGILYMDSETNRRWVLRSDDPNQLNEIDAVFVTVEPHGGSQKPTGKPLLYALLRKEANHP
jgi:hypothetical protein